MSSPPNLSGSSEITSLSILTAATSPEDRQADGDAVIGERASNQEATDEEVIKQPLPIQAEDVHGQEATDEEVRKQSTPVQEEHFHGQLVTPVSIAREIKESVEEFEPVGPEDEGEKYDQEPHPHQPRSRHETTISMIPETVSVGEGSKVVEEEHDSELEDNTEEAGFDLQKVYDRDELERVTDFPYQSLGGKRIRKAIHPHPALKPQLTQTLAWQTQDRGKMGRVDAPLSYAGRP